MRYAIRCGDPAECIWEWDPALGGHGDWVCVSGDPSGWLPMGDPEEGWEMVDVLHAGGAKPCELLMTDRDDFVWEDISRDKLREI